MIKERVDLTLLTRSYLRNRTSSVRKSTISTNPRVIEKSPQPVSTDYKIPKMEKHEHIILDETFEFDK